VKIDTSWIETKNKIKETKKEGDEEKIKSLNKSFVAFCITKQLSSQVCTDPNELKKHKKNG
jgi:hypothetical protein